MKPDESFSWGTTKDLSKKYAEPLPSKPLPKPTLRFRFMRAFKRVMRILGYAILALASIALAVFIYFSSLHMGNSAPVDTSRLKTSPPRAGSTVPVDTSKLNSTPPSATPMRNP